MTLIYALGRALYRGLYKYYCGWEVFNAERVPPTGPAILAGNHASFLDPPLIGGGTSRELTFLGRESLFKYAMGRWILSQVNAVAVDRDGGGPGGIRTILERLAMNEGVVLFPEGTRTRDGQLQKARAGIGLIVIKSGAPVVPIRMWGTFEAFNRTHKFPRPRKVMIKFGVPLLFTELRAEAQTASKHRLKEIYQEVADQIMASIAALEPHQD